MFALLFASCARPSSVQHSLHGAIPLSPEDRQLFYAEIAQNIPRFKTIRALYDARITEGDSIVPLRYGVVVRSPDSFRIDILPPQAAHSLGLLISSQGSSLFLDPQTKKATTSTESNSVVQYVLKLPLSDQELLEYLFGSAPRKLLAKSNSLHTYLAPSGDSVVIHDSASDSLWTFTNRPYRLISASLRSIFDSSERLTYLAEWENLDGKEMQIPQRITFRVSQLNVEILLSLSKVKFDSAISEALFNLEAPAGYQTTPLPTSRVR